MAFTWQLVCRSGLFCLVMLWVYLMDPLATEQEMQKNYFAQVSNVQS